MEQNLFDWLNETHNLSGQEEGLLLVRPGIDGGEILLQEQEHESTEDDTGFRLNLDEPPSELWAYPNDTEAKDIETVSQPEDTHDDSTAFTLNLDEPPSELWAYPNDTEAKDIETVSQPEDEHDDNTIFTPNITDPPSELWTGTAQDGTLTDSPEELPQNPVPEQEQSKEWQEAHTGFTLSLDEPPPEIWTRIDSPTEPDTEDEEEADYEQGMSLQGAAYIPKQKPKHGTNFTQRLQKTLQGRKERAARLREEEEEQAPHHPYIQKAAVMCGTMIVALMLSWVCLRFMQDGVAAYVERARAEQQEQPDTPESQDITPASHPEPEPVIVPITPKAPEKPSVQTKTLLTFDEALAEGNNAYNIGMYSRAIMNFHRALALRKNDIRPYIGLSASYRAKGMYFDAKRLLDEARVRFGRNPAVEMEQYYLRRE